MLKHVPMSPWRGRSDSLSLSSNNGDNSSCGSNSPTPSHTPPPSRASSLASLSPLTGLSSFSPDSSPQQTTIKIFANCLRPDIEYKTLSITFETTCQEIVENLLRKFRMRHRDPKLFFLTMEVTVRRANVRTILPLDGDARPGVLQSCHPRGDSRFSLQTRRGGLVKIYDSALMSGSKYKSLLISDKTTVDELIQMLLSCYDSSERVEQFSLYEVSESEEYQRKLHPDDSPLRVVQKWTNADLSRHLRIRRNPDYNPRRKNMWASDSTITDAISKLHLQNQIQHSSQINLKQSTSNESVNSHCLLFRHIKNKQNNHKHNCKQLTKSRTSGTKSSLPDSKFSQSLSKLSNLLPQSLPSTPLTSKHLPTSEYSDYQNYLYI